MLKILSIYLIGFLPLSLIIGPFIGELIFFLIFIFFCYYSLKTKFFFYVDKNLIKFFLIFCLYISVLSFTASETLISAKSSIFYIRFGFYTISIVYFLNVVKNSLNIIYKIYKFTLLFVIFDSLFQTFTGINFFGIKPESIDLMRISGPFGDKFILGSFLQKTLPVYIFLILKDYQLSKKIRLSDIFILTFVFAIIFRSGDRSAMGLILLYSFIFFIIFKDFRKKMIIILSFFIIISTIFSFQNPRIFERNFVDTINQFKGKYYEKFLNNEVNETNLNFMIFSFHHQSHYTTALRMFYNKPISGHGVKMFRYQCKNFEYIPSIKYEVFGETENSYGCSTHPHNTYLQLLSETGIIGFSFIFYLFLRIFRKIFYYLRNNDKFYPECSLLIGIFINLWPLIPTGNFFNNWLSMIYFIPISYYLFEIKFNKQDKNKIV